MQGVRGAGVISRTLMSSAGSRPGDTCPQRRHRRSTRRSAGWSARRRELRSSIAVHGVLGAAMVAGTVVLRVRRSSTFSGSSGLQLPRAQGPPGTPARAGLHNTRLTIRPERRTDAGQGYLGGGHGDGPVAAAHICPPLGPDRSPPSPTDEISSVELVNLPSCLASDVVHDAEVIGAPHLDPGVVVGGREL